MDSIKDLELMQLDVGIYLQSELVIQTFSKLWYLGLPHHCVSLLVSDFMCLWLAILWWVGIDRIAMMVKNEFIAYSVITSPIWYSNLDSHW